MSDQPNDKDFPNVEAGSLEGQIPNLPPVDPQYTPPKTDSRIVVRFFGNTPQVAEMKFLGCTPEHLWAAAERLRWEANKMMANQEMAQARMGLQVARGMGDIEKPGGFIHKP